MTVQPLTGIRVVDLTRVLSGPFSTMLLADMGADVVKIETPQGDTVRGQGAVVNGLSWYFASFNRNKRSVVLDLRKARPYLRSCSRAPTCWSRISGRACSRRWASPRRGSRRSTPG
jgi:CoA-transferase family III